MFLVEWPLEAVENVVHLSKAGLLQGDTGVERAVTAAADQDHGPIHACDLLHLTDEVRIDLPIRSVVPSDVMRTHRVSDEEILHLAAAVDEDRGRIVVQKLQGFLGFEMLHRLNLT